MTDYSRIRAKFSAIEISSPNSDGATTTPAWWIVLIFCLFVCFLLDLVLIFFPWFLLLIFNDLGGVCSSENKIRRNPNNKKWSKRIKMNLKQMPQRLRELFFSWIFFYDPFVYMIWFGEEIIFSWIFFIIHFEFLFFSSHLCLFTLQ